MIKQSEIVQVITQILKTEFTGCRVYSDETQEGYKTPAFFIELLQKTDNETKNFNSNQLTIIVTYLPKVHTTLDNMDVSDRLKEVFGMVLDIGERKLKIKSLAFSYTGNNKEILQMNVLIDYLDKAPYKREEYETAKELHLKKYVNKDGVN